MTSIPTASCAPTPDRIEWRRDGYTVWADDEGVHLRVHAARAFDMPETAAMLDLFDAVRAQFNDGAPFGKPTPPTREQLRTYPDTYTARRVRRVVADAIAAEFPTTDNPF